MREINTSEKYLKALNHLSGDAQLVDRSFHTRNRTTSMQLLQSTCMPAFIINLDRRADRWRRVSIMCHQHRVVPLRVSAVDGLKLQMNSSDHHNHDLSSGCADNVPESDVSIVWNAILNSTFDGNCFPNEATPMTPSERACAASHLNVWRAIDNLRGTVLGITSQSSMIAGPHGMLKSASVQRPTEHNAQISNAYAASAPGGSCDGIDVRKLLGCGPRGESYYDIALESFVRSHIGGGWAPVDTEKLNAKKRKKQKTESRGDMSSAHYSSAGKDSAATNSDTGDWYLICEDDAKFTTNASVIGQSFTATLTKIIHDRVPADFDIVYLGCVIPRGATQYRVGSTKVVRKVSYAWMLHSYVLRGRAVPYLLSQLPISAPVDNFIAQLINEGSLNVRFPNAATYCFTYQCAISYYPSILVC
jgi:GR25 family glycosyltransferase involved in LPS biosynthesis